jgi:nucleoside-diphosphate-sugar epimerase
MLDSNHPQFVVPERTALVTGAGGYIGSTLASQLLELGYRVIGYDRYFFGKDLVGDLLLHPHFQAKVKDIRDIGPEDCEGVDVVYDLASISNDPAGELSPSLTVSINSIGRSRVAKSARQAGVPRYVLASSCSVYGASAGLNLDEDSPCKPLTTYAKACLECELQVVEFARPEFTVCILRQGTVYGVSRRMRFDLVINIMTLSAWRSGSMSVTGGGHQWRPFVHVSDTAAALRALGRADKDIVQGQTFNAVAENMTIGEAAKTVADALPIDVRIDHLDGNLDRRDYHVNADKIKRAVGWAPRMTVATGAQEVFRSLEEGHVHRCPRSETVTWYKSLIASSNMLLQ